MPANLTALLAQNAVTVAQNLLGWEFYRIEPDGSLTGGVVSETEAYTQTDAASHSYKGITTRNATMFGPAGNLYVYFTYGMHWCANIVTGQNGSGEAVLLRKLQPLKNIELMMNRRKVASVLNLCNGPAKICQALAIDKKDNGAALVGGTFTLVPPRHTAYATHAEQRIGITKDTHRLWRFVLVD